MVVSQVLISSMGPTTIAHGIAISAPNENLTALFVTVAGSRAALHIPP